MALGTQNNQNDKKVECREGLTRIRFYNPNSSVDPSTYQIKYLFGMMKLVFSPMLNNATPDNARYDYENSGTIYINHMDALILIKEIELFLQDPTAYHNVGCVNNSGSLLSISNGVEFGITQPIMVLRKIDENGDIVYTYAYEFVGDYFAVRNFDKDSKNYDKFFYGMAELEMLKITLEEYVKATTNAIAYSINDLNRYADQGAYNDRKAICEKLGIEKRTGNNRQSNGGQSGRSLLNNQGRQTNNNDDSDGVIDDLQSLL